MCLLHNMCQRYLHPKKAIYQENPTQNGFQLNHSHVHIGFMQISSTVSRFSCPRVPVWGTSCFFPSIPIWGAGKDQHCRLHRMGNDFYVMALESQIGTLVDGQLLGQRALA